MTAARICGERGGPLLSVQLDHGTDDDHVLAALEAGVDSVMWVSALFCVGCLTWQLVRHTQTHNCHEGLDTNWLGYRTVVVAHWELRVHTLSGIWVRLDGTLVRRSMS